MKTSVQQKFEEISQIRDAQSRGFKFQEMLRTLLEESRFEVIVNPAMARPRQTDLFACRDEKDYLIEAKWQKRKISSADIDALRSRLGRVPTGVFGCIFSMSPFTECAIEAVENDRRTPILLFGPGEITTIVDRPSDIPILFKQKRKVLTSQGKTWFLNQKTKRAAQDLSHFPAPSRSIFKTGSQLSYWTNPTDDISELLFAESIPDINWGVMNSNGVGINIALSEKTQFEIKHFLALVHNQLGFSSEGSFTIRQLDCYWHGYGIENFLCQIARWRERYREAKLQRIHHSEDLHYFDSCETGYCLFSARQTVNHGGREWLDMCELEVHLAGIPVNTAPFLRVCEESSHTKHFFSPFISEISDTVHLKKPICIEPVAQVITTFGPDDRSVTGLIAKNPFKDKNLIPTGNLKYSLFRSLSAPEHIICQLSDWHDPADKIDKYRLKRIEATPIGQIFVYRCVGTWDNMIDRGRKL